MTKSAAQTTGTLRLDRARRSAALLIAYFRSGWAFLIPYLVSYLTYYYLKWPANSFAPDALGHGGHIPALFHIYWALHVVHVVLLAIALRSWCQNASSGDDHRWRPLFAAAPWLSLALLFAIPGIYLEWPADPWEHLRRITEWSAQLSVDAPSSGYKIFYFLPYTLVGWIPAAQQLIWLNVYNTAVCLLLLWQYYLLARTAGLFRRWGVIFVVVNALTFGNSCFSFYRYYGLASTMFAQIGAVALTRLTLEAAQALGHRRKLEALSFARTSHLPFRLFQLVPAFLLVALVAYDHVQGLGIAALAVASVVVWRLLDWKRSTFWWLLGITLGLSAASILWWPRQPDIDGLYRPQGWLSAWYGFNLFALHSPAADRMLQILGLFGLLNLFAGCVLLWRNNAVGWLTVGPAFALTLPFIALPFADVLSSASDNGTYIVAFHRMFFAIPEGLALVMVAQKVSYYSGASALRNWTQRLCRRSTVRFLSLLVALAALISIPPEGFCFNRGWNLLSQPPADLTLRNAWNQLIDLPRVPSQDPPIVSATTANIFLLNVHDPTREVLVKSWVVRHYESVKRSPIDDFDLLRSATSRPPYPAIFIEQPNTFFSPFSQAAQCSGHWSPQVASLSTSGAPEMAATARRAGMKPVFTGDRATLWSP